MAEPKWLQGLKEEDYIKEDFDATGKSRYTVEGVDKNDPDWLNKAAKKVHAAEGDDYVKVFLLLTKLTGCFVVHLVN